MAPNYDNNITLVSRGYGEDPWKTSPLLIQAFLDLVRKKSISYPMPVLVDREALSSLALSTLPRADIRRDYVLNMVESRWQTLAAELEKL